MTNEPSTIEYDEVKVERSLDVLIGTVRDVRIVVFCSFVVCMYVMALFVCGKRIRKVFRTTVQAVDGWRSLLGCCHSNMCDGIMELCGGDDEMDGPPHRVGEHWQFPAIIFRNRGEDMYDAVAHGTVVVEVETGTEPLVENMDWDPLLETNAERVRSEIDRV